MSRCLDCHFFRARYEFGREKRSCEDLGELAQYKACSNFVSTVPGEGNMDPDLPTPFNLAVKASRDSLLNVLKEPPDPDKRRPTESPEERKKKVEAHLGALLYTNYRDIFREILAEDFALEQDAELAIKSIQGELATQGVDINLEAKDFKKYSHRLQDLYVLKRLVSVYGLNAYERKILNREIEAKFKGSPNFTPVPVRLQRHQQ